MHQPQNTAIKCEHAHTCKQGQHGILNVRLDKTFHQQPMLMEMYYYYVEYFKKEINCCETNFTDASIIYYNQHSLLEIQCSGSCKPFNPVAKLFRHAVV